MKGGFIGVHDKNIYSAPAKMSLDMNSGEFCKVKN